MMIRKMVSGDVPQIAMLEKVCFSDPWSENSIETELKNPLSCWLVAEENGVVMGYVGSQSVLDGADMMNIAVSPEARNKGVATELIHRLVLHLREKGVRFLMLEVRQSNVPAITLYQKLGFVKAGVRPNYYRHPKENALILRKEWDV